MDVKGWINSIKMSVLYPLFNAYLGKDKSYSLSVGIGDDSYCAGDTDDNSTGDIVVSITNDEVKTYDKSTLLRILKFKMYHECSHALFTHRGLYGVCVNSAIKIWQNEATKKGLVFYDDQLKMVANNLLNSLEDGRIENIMCNIKRGLIKHRNWYRIMVWEKEPLQKELEPLPTVMNQILDVSTMGIYQKGFTSIYDKKSKIYKTVNKTIQDISKFVQSSGLTEAKKYSDNIAKIIADIVIDQIAVTQEEYNKSIRKEDGLPDMTGCDNNFKAEKSNSNKNGPIIGIITDDSKNGENSDVKPDIIIDLRKNPPKNETGDKLGNECGSKGQQSDTDFDSDSGNNSSGNTGEQSKSNSNRSGSTNGSKSGLGSESTARSMARSSEEQLADELSKIQKDIEKETLNNIKKDIEKAKKDEETSKRKSEDSETKLSKDDLKKIGVTEEFKEKSSYANSRGYNSSPDTKIKQRAARTARKLKNIIAAKSVTERTELYDGSFDTDALGRFVTGKSDIFKAPARKSEPDMCCYILKDNSGSMYGYKEEMALNAVMETEEIFKNLVPVKITAFNSWEDVNHVVIKDWKDVDKTKSYTASYRDAGNTPGGSNNDAASIKIASEELLKRPEKHKVLIVISDGLPADCSQEDVNKAVKAARKQGIFLIGFFIGDKADREEYYDNYKFMYEKYFSCVDPSTLGSKIIIIMREIIKKL